MPELHRNTPAQIDDWAPTAEEMERMFLALDRDATNELHGPPAKEYAVCIACAHGYHDTPGPHGACDCACHVAAPRKQVNLREFYTNPVAFGMKLAGAR